MTRHRHSWSELFGSGRFNRDTSSIGPVGALFVTVLVAGPVTYGMLTPEARTAWLHEIGLTMLGLVVVFAFYRWMTSTRSTRAPVMPPVAVTAYDVPMADVFCLIASLSGATGARVGAALKPVASHRDAIAVLHDALSADEGAWQHVRCWDDRRAPLETATRRAEHRLHALDVLAAPRGPTAERGYRQGVDGLTVVVLVVTAGFEVPDLGEAPSRSRILETLRLLATATGADVNAKVAVHGPVLTADLGVLQPPLLPMPAG